MKVKKIKINSQVVKEILQSNEMMNVLLEEAPKLGEVETSFVGFDRCHVVVKEN